MHLDLTDMLLCNALQEDILPAIGEYFSDDLGERIHSKKLACKPS